eukprot:gnl/Hemi2/26553_TR8923_c0_g1_i1.p1 gnl/Hemi2/26553_TR8923_c0_g1~~gnl/Hemi2/26553_TR8923_c0_g1_i1.p1  ORF type:complete len:275 (-),score=116.82 gnl/Hemi2/26553_TR8923_c0_g1_i1:140-964(-)
MAADGHQQEPEERTLTEIDFSRIRLAPLKDRKKDAAATDAYFDKPYVSRVQPSQLKAPSMRLDPPPGWPDSLPPPPPPPNYWEKLRKDLLTRKKQAQRRYFPCCLPDVDEDYEPLGYELDIRDLNLSYQDLGQQYQMKNFKAFLSSLQNVRSLNISHNQLYDLKDVYIAHVQTLYLNNNKLKRFKQLPNCPRLKVLNLADNLIEDVEDLEWCEFLEELTLRGNPIAMRRDYLEYMRDAAPRTLKLLDGLPIYPSNKHRHSIKYRLMECFGALTS